MSENIYKGTHQIKTGEFEYINLAIEGTLEEITEAHRALQSAWRGAEGISDKDFNASLDEYLSTNNLTDGANIYAKMSPQQQFVFQACKRSLKRIASRANKDIEANTEHVNNIK